MTRWSGSRRECPGAAAPDRPQYLTLKDGAAVNGLLLSDAHLPALPEQKRIARRLGVCAWLRCVLPGCAVLFCGFSYSTLLQPLDAGKGAAEIGYLTQRKAAWLLTAAPNRVPALLAPRSSFHAPGRLRWPVLTGGRCNCPPPEQQTWQGKTGPMRQQRRHPPHIKEDSACSPGWRVQYRGPSPLRHKFSAPQGLPQGPLPQGCAQSRSRSHSGFQPGPAFSQREQWPLPKHTVPGTRGSRIRTTGRHGKREHVRPPRPCPRSRATHARSG